MKSDNTARSLRILEIGSDCLFALAVPAQTEFYGTGIRLRGNLRRRFGRFGAITRAFGPVQFIRSLLKLRCGEYDLVVVHAAPFAPWHPRSFLTLLRSWNVLSPLNLFANNHQQMVAPCCREAPIVTLDLGDSFGIGRHNFFLLDVSRIYFKRELPADRWHVFFSSTYRDLPGHRWRGQAKNRARLRRLAPISYGYFYFPFHFSPEEKSNDVFFAGNADPNSTARSGGLPELLAFARKATPSTL